MLPEISPRSPTGRSPTKRRAAANPTNHSATEIRPEHVSDWNTHHVAEWLRAQATKDDYAHTFLVNGIDGPALLSLTREQLVQWKVNQADCCSILKGVQEIKFAGSGQNGQQAPLKTQQTLQPQPQPQQLEQPERQQGAQFPPPAPTRPQPDSSRTLTGGGDPANGRKPRQSRTKPASPEKLPLAVGSPPRRQLVAQPKTAPPSYGHVSSGSTSARSLSGGRNGAAGTRSSYLSSMMGELHANERVPLWKEEMVDRVKRRSTSRLESDALPSASPARPPPPGRSSLAPANRGSDSGGAASGGEGSPERRSQRSREIERRLYWYQDAIHEQELQKQLVEAKHRELQDELRELQAERQRPEVERDGVVQHERAQARRLARQAQRLARTSQVSEQRVADAERVNRELVAVINKLRNGRADFLHQMSKLNERETQMTADMKHFAQSAHASLDEKEKLEARSKRQQFEYKQECNHYEQTIGIVDQELSVLEAAVSQGTQDEEQSLQYHRRQHYANLKSRREVEQRRELRLGYLQNQARGHEGDFQRLHHIIGVMFTPEKSESVHDIISASLKNEERNSSLLGFVSVQRQQIEALEEDIRRLTAEREALLAARSHEYEQAILNGRSAERELRSYQACCAAVEYHETLLKKLCTPTQSLFELLECKAATEGQGALKLKGCRPDTLVDYVREIGTSVKALRARALTLVPDAGKSDVEVAQAEAPAASLGSDAAMAGTSAHASLRGFLQPSVVQEHPSVVELRKELEHAAQKQAHKTDACGREESNSASTPQEESTLIEIP